MTEKKLYQKKKNLNCVITHRSEIIIIIIKHKVTTYVLIYQDRIDDYDSITRKGEKKKRKKERTAHSDSATS